MAEPKRVALQSVPPTPAGDNVAAGPSGKVSAKKKTSEKKEKQIAPSIRFSLNLFESNDHKYPEFNYAELLKNAEKKRRRERKKDETGGGGGADGDGAPPAAPGSSNGVEFGAATGSNNNATSGNPFDDEDEDERVLDVARYFEAKYGNRKKSDYVDLGAGYDESDPFIDNTDVYDELVPEEVTTVHGGFYVNSGPLEFKDSDTVAILQARRNSINNNTAAGAEDDDDEEESSEEDSEEETSASKGRPTGGTGKRPLSSDNEEIDLSQPTASKSKQRKVIEPAAECIH